MNLKTPKRPSEGEAGGQNPLRSSYGVIQVTAKRDCSYPQTDQLMEVLLSKTNMSIAFYKVVENKGAPGVDKVKTEELKDYLHESWPRIKRELMEGRYKPSPVRKVEIPKPGGKGMRQLGIPTVLDRLIQQALHQILSPIFEREFSESSYGFRPGRSAHQAVLKAQDYVSGGKGWVIDIDLEKFFDRVNHDILMAKVARKIKDKRILLLIRRFLQAGIMDNGIVAARAEGTPQGGPISPLLSNIMLDDLDKELEKRGYDFCRYADDCNIYVRTQRQGKRVMQSIKEFLSKKLKLKINEEKSAVARHYRRKFLGYAMTSEKKPKLRVAKESICRVKDKLKKHFQKGRGQSIKQTIMKINPLLRGWLNYFKLIEKESCLKELDSWIRHRLRMIMWRQMKRTRTRARVLIGRGIGKARVWMLLRQQKGPWRSSRSFEMNMAYPDSYFIGEGYISLFSQKKGMNLL